MASWEETIQPNYDVAVSHVTALIRDTNILDKLLANDVLTVKRYDEMLTSDPEHTARVLLLSLILDTKLDTFLAILPEVQGGKALLRVLGATTSEAPSEEKETPSIPARREKEASSMQGLYQSDLSDTAVDSQSSLGSIIAAKVVRQMADPKWEKYLTPVRSRAVKLASDLLGSDSLFLDELVEKKCLTNSQMKKIRGLRREHGSIDAASELFDEMMKQPSPSFDTFCTFLPDVNSRDARQGKDLYNLLVKSSQLDSSMTSVAAERQEEPNGAAACSTMPDSEISESNPQHCSKNEPSVVEQVPCNTQKGEEVVQPLNPDTERHVSLKDELALSDKIKTSIGDSSEMLHGTQEPRSLYSFDEKKQLFPKKESVLDVDVTISVDRSPKGVCSKKDYLLKSPIRDKANPLPKKEAFLGAKSKAVLLLPENASDKAATSTIASLVSSTFIPLAKKDRSAVVSLGELAEQILEIMQQSEDERFTVAHVALIKNTKGFEQKGLAVLQCVTEADEIVKESFAFALCAVDTSILAKVSPNVYEEVSMRAVEEYLRTPRDKYSQETDEY